MRLQNTTAQAAGFRVLCNGTIYVCDKDGVVEVKDERDAQKLALGATWRILDATPAPTIPEARDPQTGTLAGDPPIPKDGGTWADPQPHYSLEWLTACAEAYAVKVNAKATPASLCRAILKAMYQ